jgi:hypothetical protein
MSGHTPHPPHKPHGSPEQEADEPDLVRLPVEPDQSTEPVVTPIDPGGTGPADVPI